MKYEKRTTMHITPENYDKLHDVKKELNISVAKLIDGICDEIAAGKYDHLLYDCDEDFRSIAIHQSNFKRAKEHIKDSGTNMKELVNSIIDSL